MSTDAMSISERAKLGPWTRLAVYLMTYLMVGTTGYFSGLHVYDGWGWIIFWVGSAISICAVVLICVLVDMMGYEPP